MALCIGLMGYFLLLLHMFFIAASQANGDECNLFEGSWVSDNSYPLYDSKTCPFVSKQWNCQRRPDKAYLRYKWKPNGCDLPRFDGMAILEKFRGKKILFVGDSIGSNQYESFVCLLHNAAPNAKYNFTTSEHFSSFSFPEYELTVEKISNDFLVDVVPEKIGRVLKLDSLTTAHHWLGAEVVIFNSYHWWLRTGKVQPWDYVQLGNNVSKDMDHMEAYKIGMTTWAKWVDANIDPSKTRVFFLGLTAFHFFGKVWGDRKALSCKGETRPIPGSAFPGAHYMGEKILKDVLGSMKRAEVRLLDITLLTQLRKDGHPGVYAGKQLDCGHFCLAGVPDSWNQLLYALLTQK